MSRMRRIHVPGGTVFFTVCLAQPGSWLLIEEIDSLRFAVGRTRAEHPFEVLAWTVLPDRMHAIWKLPEGDSAYAPRWGAIKARFSRAVSLAGRLPAERPGARPARGELGLWRKRFWEHHLRGPRDLRDHLDLCRLAPVRAGLVAAPEDWPFGTFGRGGQAGGARGYPRATQGPQGAAVVS